MMIVPFILTALQPLCPALFLREMLRWLIGSVGAWLIDEDYAGWLKESGDKQELRSLLSFVLFIEEGLHLLIYVRARQKLGHKGRPGRRRKPRPDPSTGHPPSFEDICRRFERACLRFTEVERLAETRAFKLKRLLEQAACQLEVIHHPIARRPSAGIVGTIGTIGIVGMIGIEGAGGGARAAAHPAQPIRAPPGRPESKQTHTSNPAVLAARKRPHAKNLSKTRCFTRQTAAGPFPAS